MMSSFELVLFFFSVSASRISFAAFYRLLRFAQDFRKYLNNLIENILKHAFGRFLFVCSME